MKEYGTAIILVLLAFAAMKIRQKRRCTAGEKQERVELEETVYDTAAFVEEGTLALKAKAERKGLTVIVKADETLSSALKGDIECVKQCVEKLTECAVEHTNEGHITFCVQGSKTDSGEFYLVISLADTGEGIDKEAQEIQSVKEMVIRLDGKFKVNSVLESGSMYTLRIPQTEVNKKPIGNREWLYESAGRDEIFSKKKQQKERITEETANQETVNQPTANRTADIEQEQTAEAAVIDKSIGMNYCGNSEEMYREVVKAYYQQSVKYTEDILQLCENEQWKEYGVIAHAIKSTSMTIGAKGLSEEAKQQEMAVKEGRLDICRQGWNVFLADYKQILMQVEQYLNIENNQDKQQEPESVLSKEEYEKECRILLQYIKDYEMGEAMEQIEMLLKRSVSAETREQEVAYLEKIKAAVDEFEYDAAEELLTEWLEKQEAE